MNFRALLLTLLTMWSALAVGQVSSRYQWSPPGGRGYVTWGLDAGWSYLSSDVRTSYQGWGVGMTLAKNMIHRDGGWLDLDIRGRALYTQTYGLDVRRSTGILYNDALNGTNRDLFPQLDFTKGVDSLGYVFANHLTNQGELAGELVFTFNRLRQRTGIIFQLYGGIGLNGYFVRYDHYDEVFDRSYASDYAGIDVNQNTSGIRNDLNFIRDGKYETRADGFGNNFIKLGIMPAVGFDLGYQLTPRWSVGVGHKFTFSGTDNLDGQRWLRSANELTNDNDLHHYTSFNMRWIVGQGGTRCRDPKVEFRDPSSNNISTSAGTYVLRASVQHVSSAADVVLTVNGFNQNFNYNGGGVVSTIYLRPGRNDIMLRANTPCGSVQETRVINYTGRDVTPPTPTDPVTPPNNGGGGTTEVRPDINITQPGSKNAQVTKSPTQVLANVQNLGRGTVEMYINGNRSNDFELRGKNITASVPLVSGVNTVRFVAKNSSGQDEDEVQIRLIDNDPPPAGSAPTVDIVDPSSAEATVGTEKYTVRGIVRNVGGRNEVTVRVNGISTSAFTFDNATKAITTEVSVPATGKATVEISATNTYGTDSESCSLRKLGDIVKPTPPQVTIVEPANGTKFTNPLIDLRATVLNVDSKEQVTLTVNGVPQSSITWDSKKKQITGSVTLREGSNNITVRANNAYGTDEASSTVTYTAPRKNPPLVTIQQPANNSVTNNSKAYVRASVKNVTSRTDIDFRVNGTKEVIFDFNSTTGAFDANVTLKEGLNTIVIRANNADGSDEASVNVSYNVVKNPPVVTIQTPKNNSTVNTMLQTLTAKVTNVTNKADIELRVNGIKLNQFDYSSTTGLLDAQVTLKEGSNTIDVRATNADGNDQAVVNVNYLVRKNPPMVDIQQPTNGSTTGTEKATLKATVKNADKGGISVTLNGSPVMTFNYNPTSNVLEAGLTLKTGANTIVVKATNADGTDQATTTVTYNAPTPISKPDVTITAPKSGSTTNVGTSAVTATITNVTKPTDVTYTINGVATNAFTLKGTAFTSNTTLKKGTNTLTIRAVNAGGSDEATTIVIYEDPKPAVEKPTVSFIAPKKPGTVAKQASRRCTARVTGVAGKKDVTVLVNGKAVPNFQYDATNGEVGFTAQLKEGVNNIEVSATNVAGTAKATTTVNYNPVAAAPPVINVQSVSQPVASPFNPNQASSTIIVTFDNITAANQISLKINGTAVTTFNYNASTSTLTHTFQLAHGTSTIVITATNPDGTDTETRSITW